MFTEGQKVKIVKITGKDDSETRSLLGKVGIVDYVSVLDSEYPVYVDVSQVSNLSVWFFKEDELEAV